MLISAISRLASAEWVFFPTEMVEYPGLNTVCYWCITACIQLTADSRYVQALLKSKFW